MRVPRRPVRLAVYLALAALAWGARHRLATRGGPASPGRVLPATPFLVEPYLQLGEAAGPDGGDGARLEVLWQSADRDERWAVEVRGEETGPGRAGAGWRAAEIGPPRRIAVEGVAPHRLYRARVAGLPPGGLFRYRVARGDRPVFEASARAPAAPGRPHRFVAFGDCAAGTAEQRAVAYQAYLARPDFVLITGDVVYYKGRVAEYLAKFWPVYNAHDASPSEGAPLLRSVPFVAAPGNHDLIERDLDRTPDGLAYFYEWSMPLNGPEGLASTPGLKGTPAHRRAFLDAAGPAYPRMANFSFDYGGAHWTVLDANPYVDWSDPALRRWIERDLDAARGADWRFVAFHQPGFHSSKAHADDQRSRRLAPLLERGGVDLVFNGHVHNYQRTYPLRFAEDRAEGKPGGLVPGRWTLDRRFDGAARTRPDGIIYIITGAGGARLYDTERPDDDDRRQEFTARFVASTHSLTVVDVAPGRLLLRQVSKDGRELDRIVVTRPPGAPGRAAAPPASLVE